MDNSKIVFLINDEVSAVSALYEPETGVNPKAYIFKTFEKGLVKGDLVIVETDTRFGYTVCKIAATDLDVDFDSPIALKWIVGRLDMAKITSILEQEAAAITAVNAAEKRRKKAELRASLFKDHEESINSLQLASSHDVVEPDLSPDDSFFNDKDNASPYK